MPRDKSKGRIEFMYWLATEVHIPVRSFIRGGFDANVSEFSKHISASLKKVLIQEITLDNFYTEYGEYVVGRIQNVSNIQDRTTQLVDYYESRWGFDVKFKIVRETSRTIESYSLQEGGK